MAGRSKFLDITCSFANAEAKCAIELKFKTDRQAAQDYGRIDAYVDIAALELACKNNYDFGRLYDHHSSAYINESKRGVGTIFSTHHDHQVERGKKLISFSKGREGIEIILENSYRFNWAKFEKWYFLELKIERL